MNDAYVADIGDYGKYGLLRLFNRVSNFQLGIAWMKTIAGRSSKPPSRVTIEYLDTSSEKYKSLRACDPELHRILKSLVDGNKRTIADLQASPALPVGTIYFDKLLDFGGVPEVGKKASDDRLPSPRGDWFSGALNALKDAELVFFDPDTGMETPSTERHKANGSRYIWYDELRPFFDRGKSIVVYQHSDHNSKAEQAIERRACALMDTLKCEQIWAARWHRVQSRFYFIIPADEHKARMEKAIGCLQHPSGVRISISRCAQSVSQ